MIGIKDIRIVLACVIVAIISASCGDGKGDTPEPPAPPVQEVAGRTVLVYMLASNSLGSTVSPYDYDMQDIREMQTAAAEGDITDGRLLVYHSSSNGNVVLKEILPDRIDTLKIYDPDVLSQSRERMDEVFDDMKSLAPARDYGLILWGHGSGWLQDGIAESQSTVQTYAYGEENRKWMNITTLASILEDRDFSFLYMDCCYMASVEVIYQLRKAVRRIVAYPTEVIAWGMPYDQNIKYFFMDTPDLESAAKATFDLYDSMSNPTYRLCTVGVFDTSGMDRLAAATRAIYDRNTTGIPDGYTPQPYMTSGTCYYFDFGGYVAALDYDDALKAEFDAALSDVVLYEAATPRLWNQIDINEHSGLSTFIMESDARFTLKNYDQLDWFVDVASALIK